MVNGLDHLQINAPLGMSCQVNKFSTTFYNEESFSTEKDGSYSVRLSWAVSLGDIRFCLSLKKSNCWKWQCRTTFKKCFYSRCQGLTRSVHRDGGASEPTLWVTWGCTRFILKWSCIWWYCFKFEILRRSEIYNSKRSNGGNHLTARLCMRIIWEQLEHE